jgi:hypothetical protein
MRNKTFTFFLSLLVICCFSSIYSQSSGPQYDKYASFVINPHPNPIGNNIDSPIEEVFGSNAFILGPSGVRGRGNMFHCTVARKLVEHRMYLNPSSAASMQFLVYEGAAFNGIYNLVSSIDVSPQGPGEGWYSSGAMDYDLQAGMYYLIYAQWDINSNYYNNQGVTPYPVPCSFGEQVAGIGWNWVPVYSVPPPATQNQDLEVLDTGVSYYQTIVTDDLIPVEMSSFTFNVSGNKVVLNWRTATETNNNGFEVQRKTSGEWQTIGFINGSGTTTQPQAYSYTDAGLAAGTYTYRLNQVDFDGTSHASSELVIVINKVENYSLEQNYPNPFNPTTQISYSVSQRGNVNLVVYDLLGREVANLVNEVKEPGSYKVNFNAVNLPSGVYAYRIQSGNFVQTKKMMLMK